MESILILFAESPLVLLILLAQLMIVFAVGMWLWKKSKKKGEGKTLGPEPEPPRPPLTNASRATSAIFISHRRDDSSDVTGRIYDRLIQHFGEQSVFKDVDSIPLGVDFRRHLGDSVGRCDVLPTVIGRQWLIGDVGQRRRARSIKSLDRSASDGLFLDLFGPAEVDCNRRARSTQPLGVKNVTFSPERPLMTVRFERCCCGSRIDSPAFQ